MSTGIVLSATPPRMAMSSATTTKVYGRRRASLTIHIGDFHCIARAGKISVGALQSALTSIYCARGWVRKLIASTSLNMTARYQHLRRNLIRVGLKASALTIDRATVGALHQAGGV